MKVKLSRKINKHNMSACGNLVLKLSVHEKNCDEGIPGYSASSELDKTLLYIHLLYSKNS